MSDKDWSQRSWSPPCRSLRRQQRLTASRFARRPAASPIPVRIVPRSSRMSLRYSFATLLIAAGVVLAQEPPANPAGPSGEYVIAPGTHIPLGLINSVSTKNAAYVFFSSRRRHTRLQGDWSSDVCSSDLPCHPVVAASNRDKLPRRKRVLPPATSSRQQRSG